MSQLSRIISLSKKAVRSYSIQIPPEDANFNKIIKKINTIYIDKTHFAANIMMEENQLLFFNRPRRFGKSTLLQTVDYCYTNGIGLDAAMKQTRDLKIYQEKPFDDDELLNTKWKEFKRKAGQEKYVSLYLDFSNLKTAALEGRFSKELKELIFDKISENKLFYELNDDKIIVSFLNKILEKNYDGWDSLLRKLISPKSKNDPKIVILVDEYESPLLHLMDLKFSKPLLQETEKIYNDFFGNIKSLLDKSNLIKVVMTGVICLRHLNAFSSGNSFINFSLDTKYSTAFGFTINEVKKNKQVLDLIDHLLQKHKSRIPQKYLKITEEEQRTDFLSALFEKYNGFHFTRASLRDENNNNSLISPISFIKHLENLHRETFPINPYYFKNYWNQTGGTAKIRLFAKDDLDPIACHRNIDEAMKEPFDLETLTTPQDYKSSSKIPLDMLLFNTGYFTMRNMISDNLVQLDWTSQETKEAFFKLYVEELDYKTDDLLKPLQKDNISLFVKVIEKYFLKMLKKHYSPDYNDDEHNQVFLFFNELLTYTKDVAKINVKMEIYDRFRLTRRNMPLTSGQIPDLIFIYSVSKDKEEYEKKCLILEFYKE